MDTLDKNWTEADYLGNTYRVPVTGRDENLNAMLTEIPDDHHAMAFLMQDGNLAVPGGRYGRDTVSCAPVAMALAKIMQYHNGEPITYYSLDSDMGLVVNGADDVADLIRENATLIDLDPSDYLDGEDLYITHNFSVQLDSTTELEPEDVARVIYHGFNSILSEDSVYVTIADSDDEQGDD